MAYFQGDSADNLITGTDGSDYINGGAGNDVLDGGRSFNGASREVVEGARGVDTLLFTVGEGNLFTTGGMIFRDRYDGGADSSGSMDRLVIKAASATEITRAVAEDIAVATAHAAASVPNAPQSTFAVLSSLGLETANIEIVNLVAGGRDYVLSNGTSAGDAIIVPNGVTGGYTGLAAGGLVLAGAGSDNISGSNQADILFGDAGSDYIVGNGGDDVINGGVSHAGVREVLMGMAGSDTMVLTFGEGAVLGSPLDRYNGGASGSGMDWDILCINLTQADLAANGDAIRADLIKIMSNLSAANVDQASYAGDPLVREAHSAYTLGLEFWNFEELQVMVDGVKADLGLLLA